jgi:hypothetical protein
VRPERRARERTRQVSYVARQLLSCGRPLREPESVARLYGPQCWESVSAAHGQYQRTLIVEHYLLASTQKV